MSSRHSTSLSTRLLEHQALELEWTGRLIAVSNRMLTAWQDIKSAKLSQCMSVSSDRDFALAALVMRQISLLDAAAECTKSGRPEATSIINRSMYEIWASALAVGFYKDRAWNPEKLGRRLLDHADYISLKFAQDIDRQLRQMLKSRGFSTKEIQEYKSRLRSPSNSFKSTRAHWFPPVSGGATVANMFDALWPVAKRRKFPRILFPRSRDVWMEQRFLMWEVPSLAVHATGYGLMTNRHHATEAVFSEQRYYYCHYLKDSIDLFGRTVQAIAHVHGLEREWDLTSHTAYEQWIGVCASSYPFLVVEPRTDFPRA